MGYIGQFGVIVSKFVFRFLCSQDGFLTIRECELAPSNSGACYTCSRFHAFWLFYRRKKNAFSRALTVLLIIRGYIGDTGQFGVNFPKFFSRSLSTLDGFLTIQKDDLASFTPCTLRICPHFCGFWPLHCGKKNASFSCLYCVFPFLAYKQYLLGRPLPFR